MFKQSFAMKKGLFLCSLFLGLSIVVYSQTIIRFVPHKSLKSSSSQTLVSGQIKQIGNDFSHEVQLELPDRKLNLQFRPSAIKQYDKIYTSDGERPSQAELYEASSGKQKYYLTSINKQFHGLFFSENEEYWSIDKQDGSFYTYQKISKTEDLESVCAYDLPEQSLSTAKARIKSPAMALCVEFSVGFVCDYKQYIGSGANIAKLEAENLKRLAIIQIIFSPFTFKTDIAFKAIGHMIYTDEDSSPWTTNANKILSEPLADLHSNWQKPEVWKKHKALIVIGITGINFSGIYIGYAKSMQNKLGMGTFIIKGFLDASQSVWVASHEMGHIFGAQHDGRGDGASLMQPNYSTTNWSKRSKDAINAALDDLDQRKLLYECSQISLSYELEKDSITFEWQTNYDDLEDKFIIEFSSDKEKTWHELSSKASKGAFTYQYGFISQAPLSEITYYRVRQQGFNEIISNSVAIAITSTENLIENIKVFPNPFVSQIQIQLLAPDNISIYNISGKRVLNTADKQTQHTIDTSAWPAGIYFIQAKSSQKVYKVVK